MSTRAEFERFSGVHCLMEAEISSEEGSYMDEAKRESGSELALEGVA